MEVIISSGAVFPKKSGGAFLGARNEPLDGNKLQMHTTAASSDLKKMKAHIVFTQLMVKRMSICESNIKNNFSGRL